MKEKIIEWFNNLEKRFPDTVPMLCWVFYILFFLAPLLDYDPKIARIIFYLYVLITIFCIRCVLKSFLSEEKLKEHFNNLKNSLKYFLPRFCAFTFIATILYWMLGLLYIQGYPKNNQYQQSYVYAFPNEDYAKNYRVKADLEYDSETGYQVSKIYFDNGGSIEFNSCEDGNKKGNLFYCVADNDERDWAFRYYGEKVQKTNTK